MIKRALIVGFLLLAPFAACAQTGPVNGYCTQGGTKAAVSGLGSTNFLQGIVPKCTVTVYIDGYQSVTAATYQSGGTVTGSATQTCNATFTGGVSSATGTIALTGTNSIAASTAFVITAGGQYATNPTTATLTSGTATCSGTVAITPTMGPASATIYADKSSTPLTNPFTASATTGQYLFYAGISNCYDIVLSGGIPPNTYSSPSTITGACLPIAMAGVVAGQTSGFIGVATSPTTTGSTSPIDVGITTPGVVTSSDPFAATALNGVYDLKASFGASGSQQTATCTANGTATLTGCSTADFKTGNGVYIQAAGVSATISTPSAPTVTCVQTNSSCTGSVVYCYEIAAIQSAPNGAMTAASPSACSTQAAQTYPTQIGAASPTVYTTVTLPSGTHISLYAVYKSVNGGPYNFYALLTPQTLSDYNDHSSIFSAADLGLPATAPAAAVPNDVYAIATVSGTTMTLSNWTAQPKYNQNGADQALPGTPYYPSSPSISGTVTVQHDDTPALYAAGEALRANSGSGQLELHIPAANYNLHHADPYGRGAAIHLNLINNLTIDGDGDASKLYVSNDRANRYANFISAFCGSNGQQPTGNCIGSGFAGLGGAGTKYNITDPTPPGSDHVTLSTPSQSSNFTAKGYVNIGINASGYSPYAQEMYAEINQVLSIDSTNGILYLAYPTNKYYSATLIPPYSACGVNCAGAQPYVTPILPAPGSVFTHLSLKDFWFYGATTFENIDAFDYLTENNLTITTNEKMSEGVGRHVYINNERLTEDSGIWGQGTLFSTAAAGSADMLITGSHYVNQHFGNNSQTCSEGSVNIAYVDNIFDISGFNDLQTIGPGLFGGGSLSYGCEFSNNIVNIKNTHLDYLARDSDPTGSSNVHGNTFNIDATGAGNSLLTLLDSAATTNASGNLLIGPNTYNIGSGYGARVNGNNFTMPGLTSYALPTCTGSVSVYPQLQSASILTCTLTGNVTGFNFSSTRTPGLRYWLAFIQAASGGPYTLPAACSGWSSAIDCGGAGAPIVNPAASSTTYVELQDDGTIIHLIQSSYGAHPAPYSAAGTALPACNATNVYSQLPVSDAPTGSLTPGTAYNLGGGTIKVIEQCAYSGSAYAWQSE